MKLILHAPFVLGMDPESGWTDAYREQATALLADADSEWRPPDSAWQLPVYDYPPSLRKDFTSLLPHCLLARQVPDHPPIVHLHEPGAPDITVESTMLTLWVRE